jgi:hypothetical protein
VHIATAEAIHWLLTAHTRAHVRLLCIVAQAASQGSRHVCQLHGDDQRPIGGRATNDTRLRQRAASSQLPHLTFQTWIDGVNRSGKVIAELSGLTDFLQTKLKAEQLAIAHPSRVTQSKLMLTSLPGIT